MKAVIVGGESSMKNAIIQEIKQLASMPDIKGDLRLLRDECVKNTEIHPNCIGIVDRAIAEIERLEKEYHHDTVHFHNKWMEAEEKLKKQTISDENYESVLRKKLDDIADLVRDAVVGNKIDFVAEICKIIKVDDDK